jgi:hypothetical protein
MLLFPFGDISHTRLINEPLPIFLGSMESILVNRNLEESIDDYVQCRLHRKEFCQDNSFSYTDNHTFAKAYIKVASDDKDETKKVSYSIKSVKIYDRYLRRILNLQINDINEIYNKIIFDSNNYKNEDIDSLSLTFENDNDRLNPAKCLLGIAKLEDTKEFLVEESILKRIKDLTIFFATIIPVAKAIITFLRGD